MGNTIDQTSATNNLVSLDEFWSIIYEPRDHIRDEHTAPLEANINLNELTDIIHSLPNNKASGPSNISYEIIKYLPTSFLEHLVLLFNFIINTSTIPSAWRHALLYPIPKPHDWEGQLVNTRPIVLLDCLRKVLVKIINQRLNSFLSTNAILQPNNQAGVQGSSTLEIINNVQAIVEHQKLTNNPLIIVIQDLSKVYDRVHIGMLQRALHRINIPDHLISFIIDLFTDRTNSIILQDDLSTPYQVLQGIDQGETISPLLWVVYYDPMFEAINKSNFGGYEITQHIPKSIHNRETHTITSRHIVQGYLDDTT